MITTEPVRRKTRTRRVCGRDVLGFRLRWGRAERSGFDIRRKKAAVTRPAGASIRLERDNPVHGGLAMTTTTLKAAVGHVRRLAVRDPHGATDRQLLDRFTLQRDEAAFAELVRRHGPMVLSACRRVLRHEQDAE